MNSRERSLRAGVAAVALLAAIGAVQVVTAESGERTISLHNIHTKETVAVVFKRGGKFVEAGLEQVNHVMRDWRRNESTRMDPELVDLLWEIHNELGSKEPIHIISGYRSRATNDQLRRTVGGQASESRHILGKAADVHFPDVPVKNLRYSALIREKGGVGYYPTSAIPFVHIDTDRVRSWPRLPRYELALLFPSGSTKHAAADGGPITREDVQVAKSRYGDLATQIASFHDSRTAPKVPVAIAAAQAPAFPPRQQVAALPPSAEPAKTADTVRPRPAAVVAPSSGDRAKLAELAALATAAPQLLVGPAPARRPAAGPAQPPSLPSLSANTTTPVAGILQVAQPLAPRLAAIAPTALPGSAARLIDSGSADLGNWSPAPAFDDEHPEELSYRPFPIAPFLTHSASEPIMAEMVHHDVAKTVDMIDQTGAAQPLRFRPGEQTARLLWSQQFTGEAIGIAKLREAQGFAASSLASRPVRTTEK